MAKEKTVEKGDNYQYFVIGNTVNNINELKKQISGT